MILAQIKLFLVLMVDFVIFLLLVQPLRCLYHLQDYVWHVLQVLDNHQTESDALLPHVVQDRLEIF